MTTPQAPTEETTTRRRGRPRPGETIQRDELVITRLREAGKPLTREEVATASELTPSLAYLSLWRLRNVGAVKRTHENGKHVWSVVTESPPNPPAV